MRGPHNIFRLIRVGATLERTGAMNLILAAFRAPWGVRMAAKIIGWPFQWLGYRGDPMMPAATRALTALGPAYIKFGQILSTRPDVVGNELAAQLRVLQDKLPPFPSKDAQKMVEAELNQPLHDVFSDFSESVAAASIAQVHKAKLVTNGKDVAVKVLRPGIEKAFRRDIDAFYFAAKMVEVLAPSSRRLRPVEVIQHFEGVVLGELDLRLESSSAGEFEKNTTKDAGFQLPKIKWSLSGKNIMTMDWVEGISAGDNAALDSAGHDRKNIGERILQLFLLHALRDGFFHADLHQGNLKISPSGDIIAYDFGIMGRIDQYTRRVYAEILFGFIRRDYKRVAEVHFEAGYVPADKDIDEFAQALRAVGEPIFGMDANQISMGRVLTYLFNVTEQFGMETRTELILLQRTMVVVEGVARSLHPQINIWEVARPIVQDYINESIGPKALAKDLLKTFRVLARFGPKLPQIAEDILFRTYNSPQLNTNRNKSKKRWVFLALIIGLILGWSAPNIF